MFTGIIEEIGIVKQLVPGKVSYRLTVSANKVLEGTQVGDSIATTAIILMRTSWQKLSEEPIFHPCMQEAV